MADEVHAAAVAAGHEATASEVSLKRALTLPHAVLYGMGVTVGAGIYVLIGAADVKGIDLKGSVSPLVQ
jgi:hypothetical protein